MITSPDSPPIGNENTTEQQIFISHKPTPKIDKAVNKIKANKPDSAKQDTPKVVFLDNQTSEATKNTKDNNEQINAIERERERMRLDQANIISIIPADTNTNRYWNKTQRTQLNNTHHQTIPHYYTH